MKPQYAIGTQHKVTHEGRTFTGRIQGAYLHFGAWRYTVVDLTAKNWAWRPITDPHTKLERTRYTQVHSPRGILVPESAFGAVAAVKAAVKRRKAKAA